MPITRCSASWRPSSSPELSAGVGSPALAAPRFEIANDLQLLVTDRFEAQTDQYLLTQPAHAHDADVGIDNTGEIVTRYDKMHMFDVALDSGR